MPQILSGNFEQIFAATTDLLVGNIANFTDLSQLASEAAYNTQNDATDQTTFGASGGSSAENITRGALDGRVSFKVLFEPSVLYWMQQVWGLPTGFLFMGYSGSNAAPAPGDEVFLMSSILLSPPLTYNPGSTAIITVELMPVDGGLYAPDFYKF